MSAGFRVFLISPAQIVVYSLGDASAGTQYMFNAGSLEPMPDPQITSSSEITGRATPKFGTRPVILGYKDGSFEIVYAPLGTGYVFKSDGTLAQHGKNPVIAKSVIRVPDLESSSQNFGTAKLVAVELSEPDNEAIQKFITMSQNGVEYTTGITYDELKKPSGMLSPGPELAPPVEVRESTGEVEQLKQEVQELKSIVKALTQRIYQIYPVELPREIKLDGKVGPVISLEDIQKRISRNEIEKTFMEPLLQPYAGSHRSTNRLLTFHDKDGKMYHVRASYDAKTNKMDKPL